MSSFVGMLNIVGKRYHLDVIRSMPAVGVAFLIPCHNGIELTALAVDAIHAFTAEVAHEVWVIDNASSRNTRRGLGALAEEGRINLILNYTRPWPWWRRPNKFGSWANGVALEIAANVIPQWPEPWLRPEPWPRWYFVMHNDALPIRAGWLMELDRFRLARSAVAVGVKQDPHPVRVHAMHQSGFIVPSHIAAKASFLPSLPHFDAGDRITTTVRMQYGRAGVATTPWHPHRPRSTILTICECPPWLADTSCDVSTFGNGRPFYVHKGGGSAMTRREITAWVTTAREALDLKEMA